MKTKQATVTVYGADQICSSCIHSPSSKDTYEWLDAAISRKFPNQPFVMKYVDIFNPPESEKEFAKTILEDEMLYPVVVINGEIVGEGDPRLKVIFNKMEQEGYQENI